MGDNAVGAQAAMEYVITYGWALLIITVAAALLFYFIGTSQAAVPNTCTFSSGVSCVDIIIGSNALGSNTAIVTNTLNQLPNNVINPVMEVSLNGVNVSSASCSPVNVAAGGSILCTVPLTTSTAVGQYFSGGLYLTIGDCGLVANYLATHSCVNPPQEIFIGTFAGHAEPYNGVP